MMTRWRITKDLGGGLQPELGHHRAQEHRERFACSPAALVLFLATAAVLLSTPATATSGAGFGTALGGFSAECCDPAAGAVVCPALGCVECACSLLPSCCEEWSAGCAELASSNACALACPCSPAPPPDIDCCSSTSLGSCDEQPCVDCVCAANPACCGPEWPAQCADLALVACQQSCTCACGLAPDCLFPNGCTGAQVPTPSGCVSAQVGASNAVPGCAPGLDWDPVECPVAPPPVDTVFVDAAAPGPGTGTPADPFPTIAQGIAAAPPQGRVCVAKGDYLETPVVNKPLTIAGACPSTSRVVGGALRIVNTQRVRVLNFGVRLSPVGGIHIVQSHYVALRNVQSERNLVADLLIHDSVLPGAPPPGPSPCGCGPWRNIDVCHSNFRFALAGGAGIRAKFADDIRILQCRVETNAGVGILTDGDAIVIQGSRLVGNRVGAAIRNPRESVLAENNTVEKNRAGGLLVIRTDSGVVPLLFRASANRAAENGGVALLSIDTAAPSAQTITVLRDNDLYRHRTASIFTAGSRVEIAENTVSHTSLLSASAPMESGRGIEVQSSFGASLVLDNDIQSSAGAALLITTAAAASSSAADLLQVSANTVTSNSVYGISVGSLVPTSPPNVSCQATASCATVKVQSNSASGNGGSAFLASAPEAFLDIQGNSWATGAALSQPVGTFRYAAALDRAAFAVASNTFSSALLPTALLLADPVGSSSVGSNSYSGPQGTVDIALNSSTAQALGIPPGPVVVENAALPMPCPLMPLSAAELVQFVLGL